MAISDFRPFTVTFADGFAVKVHAKDEAGAIERATFLWSQDRMQVRAKAPAAKAVAA